MSTTRTPGLEDLRREIDRIDEELHELVVRRAEVARHLRAVKGPGPAFRPAREAALMRKLIARHHGELPVGVLVRIWREMIGANISLQQSFAVAVADGQPGVWDLARDHYGSHGAKMSLGSPAQVVHAVAEREAQIGVLAMPDDGERQAWWTTLAGSDQGPRVVSRLPFVDAGNARGEHPQALAIALNEPEVTGSDRALVAIETADQISRTRLAEIFGKAGFAASVMAIAPRAEQEEDSRQLSLVEVHEFLRPRDPRLAVLDNVAPGLVSRATVIGAYAEPLNLSAPR